MRGVTRIGNGVPISRMESQNGTGKKGQNWKRIPRERTQLDPRCSKPAALAVFWTESEMARYCD